MEMRIDGLAVAAEPGATILEVCDAAGRYVPRLCYYPGLGCAACGVAGDAPVPECGLCAVQASDGSVVLACATPATDHAEVSTDTPALRALRLERLAAILARHPHVCLSCPDAEGCNRDQCSYGNPPEARCCAEFGRCELGKLVAAVDPAVTLPRRPVAVPRHALTEGRIRFEQGLCIGCGRCVRACRTLPDAGDALEMSAAPGQGAGAPVVVPGSAGSAPGTAWVARAKQGGLRASGCTFCGQCVLVCPAGAFTAPGQKGVEWVAGRRRRSGLARPVLPPADRTGRQPFEREAIAAAPSRAGVFTLFDDAEQTVLIRGVADLRRGLLTALDDACCSGAVCFEVELSELYTQRESELLARYAQEHGSLPAAGDLDDDLF